MRLSQSGKRFFPWMARAPLEIVECFSVSLQLVDLMTQLDATTMTLPAGYSPLTLGYRDKIAKRQLKDYAPNIHRLGKTLDAHASRVSDLSEFFILSNIGPARDTLDANTSTTKYFASYHQMVYIKVDYAYALAIEIILNRANTTVDSAKHLCQAFIDDNVDIDLHPRDRLRSLSMTSFINVVENLVPDVNFFGHVFDTFRGFNRYISVQLEREAVGCWQIKYPRNSANYETIDSARLREIQERLNSDTIPRRPAYDRDHLWLCWNMEGKNNKAPFGESKILKRWNDMTDEARIKAAPMCSEKIPCSTAATKKAALERIKMALRTAKQELLHDSENSPLSPPTLPHSLPD